MANTRTPIDAVVDNQKHLVDKLSKNANTLADLFEVKEVPGTKIISAYQKHAQAYFESWLKPVDPAKFVETIPERLNEGIQLQNKFYKDSFDFAVNYFKKFDTKSYEKKLETTGKIYKESAEAVMETVKKNFETIAAAK